MRPLPKAFSRPRSTRYLANYSYALWFHRETGINEGFEARHFCGRKISMYGIGVTVVKFGTIVDRKKNTTVKFGTTVDAKKLTAFKVGREKRCDLC
jgi:tetrahydromethanopterin S-methyltransferase subunit E